MSQTTASSPQAIASDRCPECGVSVIGGRAGCQAQYDEVNARAYSHPSYAATHALAFDAYCMQHLQPYCRSAKSYAAHLTRLCCGIEHAGNPKVYAAIQKWLNGSVAIEKPEALSNRRKMTVADVHLASNAEEHTKRVHEWAQCVWEAYTVQHDLARTWIKAALGA